jgi:hypothetical protein
MSRGTCSDEAPKRTSCAPTLELVYSVGAVTCDRFAPYEEECIDDTLRPALEDDLVVGYSSSSVPEVS